MAIDLIDEKVQRKFSKSSLQYDVLASLHREIGRELIAKIDPIKFCDVVLDVGMGTGWLTYRLTNILPDANIIGLDFSSEMIDVAKKRDGDFFTLQGNAENLPMKNNSVDLIMSNLAYQWVGNLNQTFAECRRILKNEGKLLVTMFGYETFHELFESLSYSYGKDNILPIKRLETLENVQKALDNNGFQSLTVKSERIKVRYPSMFDLIKWIKGIGANGLKKDIFIGKEFLKRADDFYKTHFKDKFGIYASFEIFWIISEVRE